MSIQEELEDLRELAERLFTAVEIASDYLPQHWEMDSVPLVHIESSLEAVEAFNQKYDTKIGN